MELPLGVLQGRLEPPRILRPVATQSTRDRLRLRPEAGHATLAAIDPATTPGIKKRLAVESMEATQHQLTELQLRLWAEDRRSLLIVLQGMDAAGKDAVILHSMAGLNPQGVDVHSFKVPTPEEARHHFLWRIRKCLPAPGHIAVFNRSHYEDVIVPRVKQSASPHLIAQRCRQINEFERKLVAGGTTVVKVFLHISYEEQRLRLVERLRDPAKLWKFDELDVQQRLHWDDYQAAIDVALASCSPDFAPWHVVPSDRRWYRNWAVSRIVLETLQEMDPRFPSHGSRPRNS